ncbi:hypothetical protein D3C76_1157600 [compost metagenome]
MIDSDQLLRRKRDTRAPEQRLRLVLADRTLRQAELRHWRLQRGKPGSQIKMLPEAHQRPQRIDQRATIGIDQEPLRFVTAHDVIRCRHGQALDAIRAALGGFSHGLAQ